MKKNRRDFLKTAAIAGGTATILQFTSSGSENKTKFQFTDYFIVISIVLVVQASNNHHLIVLADMGNEPDEEQQIVHVLLYANEIDMEGLIAVMGKYLNPSSSAPCKQVLHPELFMYIVDGYERVIDNLKHSKSLI